VPAEAEGMIERGAADLTSRSLREQDRRGTFVLPAEAGVIDVLVFMGEARLDRNYA